MLNDILPKNMAEPDVAVSADHDEIGPPLIHSLVLAGMHAWDESALERTVCRPLVPVAGRPLIYHTLDWLRAGGIRTASICANGDTMSLRRHLKDGSTFEMSLDYYEDLMPRGPAGCARDVCDNHDAGIMLALEGTILPNLDIADLIRAHTSSGAILTVVVTHGRLGQSGGRAYLEPAGIYVFSRAALDEVSNSGYQDIKESLIPKLHAKGQRVDTYFVDTHSITAVTGLVSYLGVSARAIERYCGQEQAPPDYRRMGNALVHSFADLDPSVRLIGPVIVERGCSLGPGVLITGPTIIGEGCQIGRDAVISRSVIWSHCQIGAAVILDHCILTDRAGVEENHGLRHAVIFPGHRSNGILLDRLREFLRAGVYPSPARKPAVAFKTRGSPCGPAPIVGYSPVRTPVTLTRNAQAIPTNEVER